MILIIDSDDDGESLVWECLEQKRTVAVMKAQGVIEKKSIAPTQTIFPKFYGVDSGILRK